MHSGIERENVLRTNSKGIRDSIPCSKSISDYNAYMGGVDKFDQLLAVYNISWKSRLLFIFKKFLIIKKIVLICKVMLQYNNVFTFIIINNY